MSVMLYDVAEDNQIVDSQVWTQVISRTGNLNSQPNFIFVSLEYGGSSANKEVGIRVLVNGTERSFDYHTPTLAGQYRKFCDFGFLQPATAGEYTISLEARALGVGQTVIIRRIRLMIMQR